MGASGDTRGSYAAFSDEFAQAADASEMWDPSDEAASREGARLKAALEVRLGALEAARRAGDHVAAAAAESAYEAALEVWLEFTSAVREDVLRRPGYISMAQALRMDLESGEAISPEMEQARREALEVLIDYVMQDGVANLGGAFKNFLAMVRKVKPEKLEGISQADLARILGETKQATQAREKARVEEVARRMGVRGFHFLGGARSEETRARSARAARGNHHRRDETARRKAAAREGRKG